MCLAATYKSVKMDTQQETTDWMQLLQQTTCMYTKLSARIKSYKLRATSALRINAHNGKGKRVFRVPPRCWIEFFPDKLISADEAALQI